MKICLDAGHYKNTPGKRTPDDIREWNLNNAVCNKIADMLKSYKNVEVVRVDDQSGNSETLLNVRVRRINAHNPAAMISIHHNACSGKWGNFSGTEVYSHTSGSAADNRLANIIAPKLAQKTGLKNRGAKKMSLAVLTCNAHIPAVLCEGGFMDGNHDSNYIRTEKGQVAYAEAVVESLAEFLNLERNEIVIEQPKVEIQFKIRKSWAGGTYNKDQFGAYTNLEKAKEEFDNNNLKYKGFFVFDLFGNVVYSGKEEKVEHDC